MKPEDTVMSGEEMSEHIQRKTKKWSIVNPEFIEDIADIIAREQAEISFKVGYEQGGLDSYATDFAEGKRTGIREVVEWGLETCPHDLFGEGTQCYKRACDECWREKWGEK